MSAVQRNSDITDGLHIPSVLTSILDCVVSINTINKEAHLLGFHSCAAAHKSLITKCNHTARVSDGRKLDCRSVEKSSLSLVEVKLWSDVSRGVPLILIHGQLDNTILHNNVLPMLRQFYALDHSYFQADNASCHVARSTLEGMRSGDELSVDWPAYRIL
ncbi:transposable element tcb1 transposase [Trichonephila clavipes]|nr:transposable element tcb1 transposase [Trichonephila clavipes]